MRFFRTGTGLSDSSLCMLLMSVCCAAAGCSGSRDNGNDRDSRGSRSDTTACFPVLGNARNPAALPRTAGARQHPASRRHMAAKAEIMACDSTDLPARLADTCPCHPRIPCLAHGPATLSRTRSGRTGRGVEMSRGSAANLPVMATGAALMGMSRVYSRRLANPQRPGKTRIWRSGERNAPVSINKTCRWRLPDFPHRPSG